MIDWGLAERIGGAVAGEPPGGIGLAGNLDALTADAVERVTAYTRLTPARAIPAPEPVRRREWLAANLRSMRTVMTPLEGKLPASGPLRAIGGTLAAAEVGGLVGFLAQRVLGQYELVLIEPDTPERLLFVAPNLREASRKLEVDEASLVAWVTFHEVTHAVQFTSVPWLRDHLGGLLRELLETVDVSVDPMELLRGGDGLDLKGLVDRVRDGGLLTLVAGPERMELIDRMQAAMAVIEGHAEHVMDAVGEEALDDLDALRAALDRRRREKPPAVRLLEKLLGLELKMRQYQLGKAFVDAVVADGGIDALNRVWEGPERLPTLAEIEDPQAWLRRTV